MSPLPGLRTALLSCCKAERMVWRRCSSLKGLPQERGSTRLHRSLTGIFAVVSGDEDDRNAVARGSEAALEL